MSHKYRFVFLHSRKTAGSAVTLSLVRYLDRGDWWLNAPAYGIMVDALRHGIVPAPITDPAVLALLEQEHGAKFLSKVLEVPAKLTKDERMAVVQAYNSRQLAVPPGGWQHITAAKARSYLGAEVWDSYFKFSFERNPWDRMASLYWWRLRDLREDEPAFSFQDFIRAIHSGDQERMRAHRATLHSNWPLYAIRNELAVDHLGRYEDLAAELQHVMDRAGVPFDGWLPQAKHKTRKSGPAELYDEETVKLVAEIFHREIALLGYRSPV